MGQVAEKVEPQTEATSREEAVQDKFSFTDEERDDLKDFARFLVNHRTIDVEVPDHGIDTIIDDFEESHQG